MYKRAYQEVKKIIDNVDINEDNLYAVINEIRNQIYDHQEKDSARFKELAEAYNTIEEIRAALQKFNPTTNAGLRADDLPELLKKGE